MYYVETSRITRVTPSKPNFQHVGRSGAVVIFIIGQFSRNRTLIVWALKMIIVSLEFGAAFIKRYGVTEVARGST
jgi:uncharacterized membrane protein